VCALTLAACERAAPQLAEFAYPNAPAAACPAPAPNQSDEETTARGVKFSVRAPANYNAAYAHPLLVVYAPAGYGHHASERYYAMTRAATAAGFIVAYAQHARLSPQAIDALGALPAQLARKWCVDAKRVYFLGHSDGGSASMGVTFMGKSAPAPEAIVASGAGINGADLARYRCPAPTRITLMHSAQDERFPGFGEQVIAWWARCNGCYARAAAPDGEGCYAYESCAAATRFCPTQGKHARWPGEPAAIIKFLTESAPAR
jgi:polyhydroxybutyrate depolymerase